MFNLKLLVASLAIGAVSFSEARNCAAQERYPQGTPQIHETHSKIMKSGAEGALIEGQVEIPVVFNIYMDESGKGMVTKRRIKQQLKSLNNAYADTPFQFVLEKIKRRTNDEQYNNCMGSSEKAVKKKATKKYPSNEFFHIYSCKSLDGILGFATFPDMYPEDSYWHGVVVAEGTINGGDLEPYNLGDTLVHEAGHFLGLYHTWGNCQNSNCNAQCDDMVQDTPMHNSPNFGCDEGDDCASDPGMNPIKNFMNYVDDACMDEFTAGQSERMIDETCMYKPSIVEKNGGSCSSE